MSGFYTKSTAGLLLSTIWKTVWARMGAISNMALPRRGGGLSAYDGESPAVIGGVFGLPYFTRTPRRRTEQPDAVSQHRDVTRDTRRLSPSRAHVPPATTSATPATTSATGWRNDSAVVQKGSNDGPGTDAPRSERERKRKSTASPRRAEKQSPAGERNPLSSAFGPKARGLEPPPTL